MALAVDMLTSSVRLPCMDIKEILRLHTLWLESNPGGKRANLSGANLSGANLSGANLSWANLSGADLSGANLSKANLSKANLSGANLSKADLSGANLSWANLSGANLSKANLSWANLSGADLSWANLSGADLSKANLSGADLLGQSIVPEKGAFQAFKSVRGGIALLQIPASAKRVGGLLGRKCRASKAKVLKLWTNGGLPMTQARSRHDPDFIYTVGEYVEPVRPFDDDIRKECTSGIHFFLTREEAENY